MRISLRRITLAVGTAALIMAAIGYLYWPRPIAYQVDYKMPGNPGPKIAAAQAAAIERRERLVDQTIWRKEMEAAEYGRVFEDFWDALNVATNKWEEVEGLEFEKLILADWSEKESLAHGIERWKPGDKSTSRHVGSSTDFAANVQKWKKAGWGIMQCEFRHNAFDPQTNDIPARSKFYVSVHLTNAAVARAVVEGDLSVEWNVRQTNQPVAIRRLDGSELRVSYREGPPVFGPVLAEAFDPPNFSAWIEPLIVYDLDGDGIPEIALPSLNLLFRRKGDHYEKEKFCSTDRLQILNGLLADFDGDGIADFLYLEFRGVFLLKGSPGGKFEIKPRKVSGDLEDLYGPRTITCGDIDRDGDLDVFVGQYKPPFQSGNVPTPYYDANDGYPCYLLRNDGQGMFADITESAGLGGKRFRRILGASFVDVDDDGKLDLVISSDFAGVDLFHNEGQIFRDVTGDWLDEPRAFGMSHAFADFNGDGKLDFVVAGMTSPTVNRLDRLGLNRPSSIFDPAQRSKMAFGSRVFLGKGNGHFGQPEIAGGVAQSGWTWSIVAADFDNDGFDDMYVGNGMISGKSVHDEEGELWLHDIYAGNSKEMKGAEIYFGMKDPLSRGHSLGGYEKNRLFWNRGGRAFVDVAHLFGMADERDCRNLIAADVDGDGRIDIIYTTVEFQPPFKQHLCVFENRLKDEGHWISVLFRDEPGKLSSMGARVTVEYQGAKRIRTSVTGDSFRSQHPLAAHFGLGAVDGIEAIEIEWAGGAKKRIAQPPINQAIRISAPAP